MSDHRDQPETDTESTPRGRLSGEDLHRLTGQIAGLTRTGLPLPPALRALAAELPSGRLGGVLKALAGRIEAGASLEEALGAESDRLPSHVRGLVAAGARSGRLGEVLGRFAAYSEAGSAMRRGLWVRLVYPVFSISLAVAILVFLCTVVAQGFASTLTSFGISLPLLTILVLRISEVVAQMWWPLTQGVLALVGLYLVVRVFVRFDLRRSLAWGVPVFGPVWHLNDLAEFCHLLALLLECEVPLVEALPMAAQGVRNSAVVSAAREAAREVGEGRSLAETTAGRRLFPAGFVRILAWAETHRGLPESLHMAGELFQAQARNHAGFLSSVFNILAVLVILGGIVTALLAVFVPLMMVLRRLVG
jgi:general secretion pathway protein F